MYNFNIIYRKALFILLFSLASKVFSQRNNAKIDSIIKIIDKGCITGNLDKQMIFKNTTDLYYLSEEAGFIEGKERSIVEEANIYCNEGNFEMALKKINEGINIAMSTNNYNTLCHLLLIYQRLLLQLREITRAKQISLQIDDYNKLVSKTDQKEINRVYILLAKAEVLVNNEGLAKDMAPVLSYKKQAYAEAIKIKNSNKYKKYTLIYALESLAWSTALAEKTDEARKYSAEIDRFLKNYPNEDLILQNLIIKGAIENVSENFQPAIKYLSEAISKAKQSNKVYILYEVYPMISASYGQLKDFENATIYSWKGKHLADSINIVREKIKNSDFINKINVKLSSKKDQEFPNAIVWAIFTGLLSIGIYLFYKRKKNDVVSNHNSTSVSIEEKLASKERELSKMLVELAKTDIKAFYFEFQKNYPTFYQSLKEKYPELNVPDLNFCVLMRMNFETKQIAVLTNSTLRSVESRRYRIMKKMNLKSQNDLYILLSKL
ncbi:hypothetical protein GCM10022217_11130 [Chryseobacterium ginsenosidimutans]|uniref:helix-turn-helix transcriptional regulator n=1 Tax=Chryseobacterium ginsenosidimutans TaxID=687846 RepID=UPI0031D298BE